LDIRRAGGVDDDDDDDATVNGRVEKKRRRGLVRSVSVRAERFIRGFDSSLEFVDGPRR